MYIMYIYIYGIYIYLNKNMTFILFDIVQQFDFYQFIKDVKADPITYIKAWTLLLIYFNIYGWFIIPYKYSAYYWFKKIFFIVLKFNLKEKFDNTHFANSCGVSFYFIALFVFSENLNGAIPPKLTLTTLIAFPAHLSVTYFFTAIMIAWHQEKFKWVEGFYVFGIPPLIIVALWLIEFLSYCMRLLSLTLRLFINLTAGHVLLKAVAILIPNILFNVVQDLFAIQLYTWPCFFLNMTFIILELLACMLQAVVMSSLIAIYLDHSIRFVH